MEKVQILLSCMNESDFSIVERSNIQTDVIIINQCNENCIKETNMTNQEGTPFHVKMICTTERGLSKSRNLAIKNATGDICIISDDDEYFVDRYAKRIVDLYNNIYPQSDILLFTVSKDMDSSLLTVGDGRVGFIKVLKSHSVLISFRRESIINAGILFDEKMGSGTGNGGGEEIKFLYQCLKKRMKIYSSSTILSNLKVIESQWFNGFDENYFENYGWSTRRWGGPIVGGLYLCYYLVRHPEEYYHRHGLSKTVRLLIKGYFSNR